MQGSTPPKSDNLIVGGAYSFAILDEDDPVTLDLLLLLSTVVLAQLDPKSVTLLARSLRTDQELPHSRFPRQLAQWKHSN